MDNSQIGWIHEKNLFFRLLFGSDSSLTRSFLIGDCQVWIWMKNGLAYLFFFFIDAEIDIAINSILSLFPLDIYQAYSRKRIYTKQRQKRR